MRWEDKHLHEFRLYDEQTKRLISIGIPTDMTPGDRPVVSGWTVAVSMYIESREWVGTTYEPEAFEPRRVVFDDPQRRWAAAFER
jgi:hypothetical protein